MRSCLGLVLAAAIVALPAVAHAKRAAPKDVPSVTYAGVRYVFPHFAYENGAGQNGGVVQARHERTNELLWTLKVYDVAHRQGLESDVQDVFITSARMEKGTLIVASERGETYEIDVAKRTARKR
jgi:hypothetical protein